MRLGGSRVGLHGAAALVAALAFLAVAPAVSGADVVVGSSLEGPPTVTKTSPVDSVYWAQMLGDNVPGAVTVAGTVRSVKIRGYSKTPGKRTIFIQVLRPQPDGSLLVVATSQPFELPETPGTYTFEPAGMTVQAGDYIGIATIGGEFVIGTNATGASTNDFRGHEQDMNGDAVRPTAVETNVELLAQIDIVPSGGLKIEPKKPPPPPPPPPKPCKCMKLTVELDRTLLHKQKRLLRGRHNFGVGFTWRMTCTEGAGGCAGFLEFKPPVIRAGTLPQTRGLKLNLTTLSFVCKTACKTSTTGRFEIKMRSRSQLNKLFGRTLAFTIYTSCGGASFRYQVKVFVDRSGRLHPAR